MIFKIFVLNIQYHILYFNIYFCIQLTTQLKYNNIQKIIKILQMRSANITLNKAQLKTINMLTVGMFITFERQ